MERTVEIHVRQLSGTDELFAPDAFAHLVGRTLELRTEQGVLRKGMKLNEAEVSEDGAYVDLVLEAPYTLIALINSGLIG